MGQFEADRHEGRVHHDRERGAGDDGEIRIVELPDHRFFVATLFLPQTRSTATRPHPLLVGYAAAVTEYGIGRV